MKKSELDIMRSGTFDGLVMFYNAIMASQNIRFEPHLAPIAKALTDRRIRNIMVIASPGTGKSLLLSVLYPAYLLGIDPRESILGISAGESLIQSFMGATMNIIEHDPVYKEVFPKSRPDKDKGWSMDRGLFVKGHADTDPDASYWGSGITSKSLTGKHGTTIILDDIHDLENSSSLDQIRTVTRAYNLTIMGRTNPKGARIIIAGRRWHVEDIYGQLKKRGDFTVLTLPAERTGQKILYFDLTSAQDETNVFTESGCTDKVMYGVDPKGQGFFWPMSDQKRRDYFTLKRSSPAEAKSVYQCQPVAALDQVFSDKYLLFYTAPDTVVLGSAVPSNKDFLGQFEHIIQSWDTAASSKSKADYSVGLTAGLKPCNSWHRGEKEDVLGKCDSHYDIYLLDETRVQLEPVKLIETVRIAHMKWKPDLPILIEKKSSGESLLSILMDTGVNCEPMTPGNRSKIQRAVMTSGNFSIQGWFQLGRIYLPENLMWVGDFVEELIGFDGSDSGVDDRVDSLIYLVSKTISLGNTVTHITDQMDDNVYEKEIEKQEKNNQNVFYPTSMIPELELYKQHATGQEGITSNPFEESCSTCLFFRKEKSLCFKLKKKTSAIYLCDLYERDDMDSSPFILDMTQQ